MKRILFLVTAVLFFLSCDKYPDPSITTLKNYTFYFNTTQNNKFFQGDWVGDSIVFTAIDNITHLQDSIKVLFDIVSGGGTLTVTSAFTNASGYVTTRWQLGTESFTQKLRARAYDKSGNYINSSFLTVYAFRNDGWDPYQNSPDANITGLVADTVNKVTFMVSGNTIYKQGERYYIWNPLTIPEINSPSSINIDKNGIIYVGTWTGDLVKSTDHGTTWHICTKPFPDLPYTFYIYVSNDNYVWVYGADRKTRYSNDGGSTWTDISQGSGLTAEGFGDIFRLKDGSLLYHGSNCCNMNRSFDNGLTWTKIETPGFSNKLFVDDKEEIYICTQEGGLSIYKSIDLGAHYTYLYSVSPLWNSGMIHTFNKWGNAYYILIQGYGILKATNLDDKNTYQPYYINSDLYDLFIDNNGVLIARTLNKNTVYYHKI